MRMGQGKTGRWGVLAMTIGMGIGLMGAYSSCSVSCPAGSLQSSASGGLPTCWYEIDAQGWRTINRGELQVKLRPTPTQTTKIAKRTDYSSYTFTFIQDPQEVWDGKAQGRFGWWRLQIKPDHWLSSTKKGEARRSMLLRWRLRDQPGSLTPAETVELVASWRQAGKRHFRTLPSRYIAKQGAVLAHLPATLHNKSDLSVFPARHNKSKALASRAVNGLLLAHTAP